VECGDFLRGDFGSERGTGQRYDVGYSTHEGSAGSTESESWGAEAARVRRNLNFAMDAVEDRPAWMTGRLQSQQPFCNWPMSTRAHEERVLPNAQDMHTMLLLRFVKVVKAE